MQKFQSRTKSGLNLLKSKMEYPILISTLNDFIFCPISIYYHAQYGETERVLFQCDKQLNGTNAHKSLDEKKYTTSTNILQTIDVYCEKYGIIGKIDLFKIKEKTLIERKKHITTIYDGYIFQLFAQYFSLLEMGYQVEYIKLYSFDDNKMYDIALPKDNLEMLQKFENTIKTMQGFNPLNFEPTNIEKCKNCIYKSMCDRCLDND